LIQIFCDGSCPRAYHVGGWAFAIIRPGEEHVFESGHLEVATNNTMELCAALMALRSVRKLGLRATPLKITTDSMYVVRGMNDWSDARGQQVLENADWWRRLHSHRSKCADLRFEWVKGHNGHRWNEWVDKMAGIAQRKGLAAYSQVRA
jgi:ribonuclease HI